MREWTKHVSVRECAQHMVSCARVYSHGGAAHQIDAEDGERVVVSERRIHTHAIRRRAWRRKRRQAEERRSGKTRQHVARSAPAAMMPREHAGVEKELRDSKHTHTLADLCSCLVMNGGSRGGRLNTYEEGSGGLHAGLTICPACTVASCVPVWSRRARTDHATRSSIMTVYSEYKVTSQPQRLALGIQGLRLPNPRAYITEPNFLRSDCRLDYYAGALVSAATLPRPLHGLRSPTRPPKACRRHS